MTDRTYAAEDEIQVTVTFSETVEVTGSAAVAGWSLEGGSANSGPIEEGREQEQQLWSLPTKWPTGKAISTGVGIEADSLSGGTIRDEARNNAELDHDGLAADSGHKVDAVKPELAASGGAVVDGTTLTLTYDEPLDRSSTPEEGDFTVSGGDRVRTVSRVSW